MDTKRVVKRAIGYGLLMIVIWNIVLLALSMIFRFETEPTVPALIVFAVVMALIVSLIVANDTTGTIFGNWAMYLVVALMALAPVSLKLSPNST